MSRILSVENLTVKIGEETILKDLSFEAHAGESLAIIGPNGSGKTMLLKCLLGLVPYTGRVEWGAGVRLGYVPQKVDADRHLPLNVHNLLSAKADILGLDQKSVNKVIASLNISKNILESPVGGLSGGQFQKALIAYALLGDPNVILCDEPTASLDQLTEEHVYDLLHDLQSKQSISVFLVSHELSVVYKYASEVLCLNKERVCFGAPEEALDPEVLKKLYGQSHTSHHHHEH